MKPDLLRWKRCILPVPVGSFLEHVLHALRSAFTNNFITIRVIISSLRQWCSTYAGAQSPLCQNHTCITIKQWNTKTILLLIFSWHEIRYQVFAICSLKIFFITWWIWNCHKKFQDWPILLPLFFLWDKFLDSIWCPWCIWPIPGWPKRWVIMALRWQSPA